MAVETIEQMSAAEKAALSRLINLGIHLSGVIEQNQEELNKIREKVYNAVGGPGKVKSNQGLVEIRKNEQITLPDGEDIRATLVELAGQRYPDLVKEEMKLKPTPAFRRILTDPGPAETALAERLRGIAQVKEVVSVRFIGEG